MRRALLPSVFLAATTFLTTATAAGAAEARPAFPTSLDWVAKGKVGPVVDVGQCGSTWAFSAVGAAASRYAIGNNTAPVPLSAQELMDCSGAQGNQGCEGGLMNQAFEYMIQAGLGTAQRYPYTAADGICHSVLVPRAVRMTGYTKIDSGVESGIMTAIQSGPVSAAVESDQQSFQFYTGGVYGDPGCGSQLDHAVLIVGYKTIGGTPVWIIQNDWGTSWGDHGYAYLQRNVNQCGINLAASYPTGLKKA